MTRAREIFGLLGLDYEGEDSLIHELPDGIYELDEDIEIIGGQFWEPEDDDVRAFAKKHPGFVVAQAYATYACFLLSRRPKKAQCNVQGSGFNYGSTNIITNCPNRLLILAEDD